MSHPTTIKDPCPTRFELVNWRLGEDSHTRHADEFNAHIERCTMCQHTVAALDKNRADFSARSEQLKANLMAQLTVTPRPHAAAGWRRGGSRGGKWTWAIPLTTATAVAAMMMIITDRSPQSPAPASEQASAVHYKGTFALKIIAQRQGQQFAVRPDQHLKADDALRFSLTTATPGYLWIVSVDAQKRLFSLYPESDPNVSAQPYRIHRAGPHVLPDSIVLDDSRGAESIVSIFSPQPFSRAALTQQIKRFLERYPVVQMDARQLQLKGVVSVVPIYKDAQ